MDSDKKKTPLLYDPEAVQKLHLEDECLAIKLEVAGSWRTDADWLYFMHFR